MQRQLVKLPWDFYKNFMRTLPDLSILERGESMIIMSPITQPLPSFCLVRTWDTIHKHTLLPKSIVICFTFVMSLSKVQPPWQNYFLDELTLKILILTHKLINRNKKMTLKNCHYGELLMWQIYLRGSKEDKRTNSFSENSKYYLQDNLSHSLLHFHSNLQRPILPCTQFYSPLSSLPT